MCLIIETKKEFNIPKVVLADMYQKNDDGYGMMWIENGEVKTKKVFGKTTEDLYQDYLEHREWEPYIHLRMRTHGNTDLENVHPYDCGNGIHVMHNGVFHNVSNHTDVTKSDTWHFANRFMLPLLKDHSSIIHNNIFKLLLEDFVGVSQRVVFGTPEGFVLLNRSAWHKITNEETQCVGMLVSNTYAWSMHSKATPQIYNPPFLITKSHYPQSPTSQYESTNDVNWVKFRGVLMRREHMNEKLADEYKERQKISQGGVKVTSYPMGVSGVNTTPMSKNAMKRKKKFEEKEKRRLLRLTKQEENNNSPNEEPLTSKEQQQYNQLIKEGETIEVGPIETVDEREARIDMIYEDIVGFKSAVALKHYIMSRPDDIVEALDALLVLNLFKDTPTLEVQR